MAPAALKSWPWVAGALSALALLVVAAASGEREGTGLDRYEPDGVLRDLPPDRVTAVEVQAGARIRRLRRTPDGWGTEGGGDAGDPGARVELGLRFLHGSKPQRVLAADEVASLRLEDAGLAPPRLRIRIWAGDARFEVDLGATNPQGFSTYARVGGRSEVYLVSRYVAGAWREVLDP